MSCVIHKGNGKRGGKGEICYFLESCVSWLQKCLWKRATLWEIQRLGINLVIATKCGRQIAAKSESVYMSSCLNSLSANKKETKDYVQPISRVSHLPFGSQWRQMKGARLGGPVVFSPYFTLACRQNKSINHYITVCPICLLAEDRDCLSGRKSCQFQEWTSHTFRCGYAIDQTSSPLP